MRFSEQKFIGGDVAVMSATTLQGILSAAGDVARARTTLGGLDDLPEALHLAHEFMLGMPMILHKELKRLHQGLAIDPLYNEPAKPKAGGPEFERAIQVHTHATYSDPEFKHDKTGTQMNQPMTIWYSLLELYLLDYFPEMGDHLIYLGRPYQLTNVFFPVNALFLHTGLPVYVAGNAELWRHGDSRVPANLATAGVPGKPPSAASAALASRLTSGVGGVARVPGLHS